jgi:hypothetical protein
MKQPAVSAITAAVVAAGVTALAVPAGAASAATVAKAAAKPIAVSTSWPTSKSGIALAYPKLTTGAKPVLFETSNGGTSWRSLPAPPFTYPADNDIPDATWAGGVIAVTNGTRIVVSRNAGRRWSAVGLGGLPKARIAFVGDVTIADGRLFALVNTITSGGVTTVSVYSGSVGASTLRAVHGLSVSSGLAYGDLTAVGGAIQVSLGTNYAKAHYWLSRNGSRFTTAPLPCPASTSALLGGVRDGKPIALCSSSPSSVGPGTNTHQLSIAPRLGGQFKASGKVLTSPNEQDFAAASDQDMVTATTFPLYVTANAGRTWAARLAQPNGAAWSDLAFPSSSVGVVAVVTVNDSLKTVGTVYRTTNGGHAWKALVLP